MAHHIRIPKTFCTTREAAKLLGVSLSTAQLWAESGLLEAWKTSGGHRRISRQSIERLLADPAARHVPVEAAPKRRATDVAPGNAAPPTPFNILVVEDDQTLRRLYEIKLRAWPMKPKIDTAGDGYEALIRMGGSKPDLLITDLQMPGIDGFRMLHTISSLPELEGVTIVVVSGLDADEISTRGGIPKGIPVLPKPVPFDQLRALAERLVAERQIPGRTEPA
jgi:excisionase family DNA binding protein